MKIVVVGTAVDVIIMQSVSSPNEWLALALDDQMCQAGIYHYFEEISGLAPGSDRQCSSIRIVMSLNPFPKPALHDIVKKRLMNVTASIGNRVFGHTLCERKRLAESGATYMPLIIRRYQTKSSSLARQGQSVLSLQLIRLVLLGVHGYETRTGGKDCIGGGMGRLIGVSESGLGIVSISHRAGL